MQKIGFQAYGMEIRCFPLCRSSRLSIPNLEYGICNPTSIFLRLKARFIPTMGALPLNFGRIQIEDGSEGWDFQQKNNPDIAAGVNHLYGRKDITRSY